MIKPLTYTQATDVFAILIEEVGCHFTLWPEFTSYLCRENSYPNSPYEFRFQGSLGFGGKFYNEYDGWRVTCYSGDITVARVESIKRANQRLYDLYARYKAAETKPPVLRCTCRGRAAGGTLLIIDALDPYCPIHGEAS